MFENEEDVMGLLYWVERVVYHCHDNTVKGSNIILVNISSEGTLSTLTPDPDRVRDNLGFRDVFRTIYHRRPAPYPTRHIVPVSSMAETLESLETTR